MIQTPSAEREHWDAIDRTNPVDLHGDPPYDVERVIGRLQAAHRHPKPTRVLDMGCGIGRLTYAVAKMLPEGMVYGFDISVQNVFVAAAHIPPMANALYWKNDGRSIPAGITGTFDLIYSVTMFQHIPHDAKWGYICQAAERIRPGGAFVFTVAVGDEPPTFLNHQLTEQELEDFASAMTSLFTTVSVDYDEVNDWTWVVAKA